SFGVFYAELADHYAALASGRELDVEPPGLQYADYALWQHMMADSGRWEGQLRFWRDHLTGAPPTLRLPTNLTRPTVPEQRDRRGARHVFSIDVALTDTLHQLGSDVGVTPFMMLFAAFGLLLGCYQGDAGGDVIIGVPIDGRFDRRLSSLIGMFINT